MQPTQSKTREAVKLAIAFTLGALTGEAVDVVGSDDQPATAIVGCGDSGSLGSTTKFMMSKQPITLWKSGMNTFSENFSEGTSKRMGSISPSCSGDCGTNCG